MILFDLVLYIIRLTGNWNCSAILYICNPNLKPFSFRPPQTSLSLFTSTEYESVFLVDQDLPTLFLFLEKGHPPFLLSFTKKGLIYYFQLVFFIIQ